MGFSSQEHWSGLPFPSPGDLPDPGIEPTSSALAGRFFSTSATWEAPGGTIQLELGFYNIQVVPLSLMRPYDDLTWRSGHQLRGAGGAGLRI